MSGFKFHHNFKLTPAKSGSVNRMSFRVLHLQLNLAIFAEFNNWSRQNFAFIYVAFNQTYSILFHVLVHVNTYLVAWILSICYLVSIYGKTNFGSLIEIIKIDKGKKEDLNRWWPRNDLVWKWGDFAKDFIKKEANWKKRTDGVCTWADANL